MNLRTRQRIACLLLIGSTAFRSSTAGAQDASDLVKQGVQLRREGRDAEALPVFALALSMDGSPRTRAQLALAEQALGLWVEAERDLSAALAAGDGPWFVQNREALSTALDAIRRRLATLSVQVNVDGAELWINGGRAGTTPMPSPMRVVAGSVVVEARADGFSPQTHRLAIPPGAQTADQLELRPLPVAAPVTSAAPREPAPVPSVPARERSAANVTTRRTAAWFSIGVAAALSVGGTVALLVHDGNATTYDDDSRCFYGGLTRDQRCGSYRDTAAVAQALAIAQFAAAGVGIAAGTFLFLSEPKDLHPRAGAACLFGVGVTCKFAF